MFYYIFAYNENKEEKKLQIKMKYELSWGTEMKILTNGTTTATVFFSVVTVHAHPA